MMNLNFSRKIFLCAALCCILFGSACSKESATASLQLTAYNHTDQGIGSYSVKIEGGDSAGAGYLDAGAGGGKFSCCMEVPKIWKPGIKVTVTWDGWENGADKMITRVATIPEYDAKTASRFNVHFLRSGDAKVFVTRTGLRHRDYPLKGKEAELISGVPIEIIWE